VGQWCGSCWGCDMCVVSMDPETGSLFLASLDALLGLGGVDFLLGGIVRQGGDKKGEVGKR
jgi:hypothetical protein